MVELTEQTSSSENDSSDEESIQHSHQQTSTASSTSSKATSGSGASPAFSNDFQQLLQLASHLKSCQPEVREKRQKWDSLKFSQKNTVLTQKLDAQLRYAPVDKQSVADRLDTAQLWKTSASSLFKNGEYQRASLEYQRTIGLFQWARKFQTKDGDEINWYDIIPTNKPNTDATTQPSGLDASSLATAAASESPIDFVATPLPSPALEQAQQIVFTCLVNIAACEEKLSEWHQVIDAAELALAMPVAFSSTSASASSASTAAPNLTALRVKALYRAAMAYNKLDELEKAIAYLQRAVKLAPKDAAIAQELANLKQAAVEQSHKDQKNYGGLFDRGAVFDEQNPTSSFHHSKDTKDQRAPKVDASGALPVEAADQTKQFMQDYLSGFSKLQKQEQSKSKSSASSSQQTQQRKPPTNDDDDIDGEIDTQASRRATHQSSSVPESLAAMYADAKANFGIDLSDPMVQEELRRMQEEHMRTGKPVKAPKESASSSTGSKEKTKSGESMTDVPSDLGGGSWIGPVMFCIIFAILLRWMKIV